MSDSPYKFLDSYAMEDRALFFGREQETEVLLADVALSRLVVLFSRTGTGKTSLINAAVRPALEDRGFATFLVRLREGDPVESALGVLPHEAFADLDGDATFAARLEAVVKWHEGPIAIFFDQFEEFFLYQLRRDPDRASAFIADVARLYRDRRSGVHVVFSMREDFYVELDAFRDAIPTIFHNDSNLRLRWFDPAQARRAMTLPAAARDVELEDALVDRVIRDLSGRTGRVEPAELQIVCDTLWREASGDGGISLHRYLALGSAGGGGTVAEQILNRRLAEQFEVFDALADFELLALLLQPGVLSTERGTKYVRDLDGLARDFGDIEQLERVLGKLEEARLIARFVRDDLLYVELVHDYLVADPERLRELRTQVRNIWPRRVLWWANEQSRIGDVDEPTSDDLVAVLRRAADEHEERERDGAARPDHLALRREDAELLLRLGLRRGVLIRASFEIAEEHDVPVWSLLRETIQTGRRPDAPNAVDLLGQVPRDDAVELLIEALADERLARGAVSALERAGTPAAVDALAGALADDRLAGLAAGALTTLAAAFDRPETAQPAATALLEHLARQLDDPRTAPAAIGALGALPTAPAVDLLARVRQSGRFRVETERALLQLKASAPPPVAERAARELATRPPPGEPAGPVPDRVPPSPPRPTSTAVGDDTYWLIGQRLLSGRVTPFLGPGAAVADRPVGSEWRRGGYLPYGNELAEFLGQRSRYPERPSADLARVSEYVDGVLGERTLYTYLRDVFDADYPPNRLHHLLATVPEMLRERRAPQQLIITTNFDDALERAFAERQEPFDVVVYEAKRGESFGHFIHRTPEGTAYTIVKPNEYVGLYLDERPVILKLAGSVDRSDPRGDSYVITEDDYVDYLGRANVLSGIPVTLREALADNHMLFLGYSISDWSTRAILRRVLGPGALDLKSWAVARMHDNVRLADLERKQWRDRGDVEVLGVGVGEFTNRLSEELAGLSREEV